LRSRRFIEALLLGWVLFGSGCAIKKVVPPPPAIPPSAIPKVQYGWASWYGEEFHGRPTASGSIFDMYQLTAAHNTLPLGTKVLVTNLQNGRCATVIVNDRGPFVPGRVIDLSYAAAKALGMVEEGLAWVRIEVLDFPEGFKGMGYTIQVGAFQEERKAYALMMELRKKGFEAYVSPFQTQQGRYYRVRIGSFSSKEEAKVLAEKVALLGYDVLLMPY